MALLVGRGGKEIGTAEGLFWGGDMHGAGEQGLRVHGVEKRIARGQHEPAWPAAATVAADRGLTEVQ